MTTLPEYEKLFEGAERFKAIGEASPSYLFYKHVAPAIRMVIPNCKIIVILREPCVRAFSHYVFNRLWNRESEGNFLDAIETDNYRPEELRFHYLERGLYCRQLIRYFQVFQRGQIKVVFNDELRDAPHAVLTEIFKFLDVDPKCKVDVEPKLTVSGTPRSKFIHWLLAQRNPIRNGLRSVLPGVVVAAARKMKNANLRQEQLSAREHAHLHGYFSEDITRLEKLLDMNLHCWQRFTRETPMDRNDPQTV